MFLPLPPRARTPEWWSHWRRSVIGVAVLAAAAAGLLYGAHSIRQGRQAALAVIDYGERAQGHVIARDYTTSKNSKTYHLSYHFDVNGVGYEARHSVDSADYVGEGSAVEVAYDALDPSISYLVRERGRRDSVAAEGIVALLGAAAAMIGVAIWMKTSKTRWLWLNGIEVRADASSVSMRYRFQVAGQQVDVREFYGAWVVRDAGRAVLLADPDRPARVTPLTPQMLTADRLAEATEPSQRVLPAAPRAENAAWRGGIKTTGTWIGGAVLLVIGLLFSGCAVPIYQERAALQASARKTEGIVVERTPGKVTYVVEGQRLNLAIGPSHATKYGVGAKIPVYVRGRVVYAESRFSTSGPIAAMIAGGAFALLAVVVALAGLRAHWRGRVLWREGIEVHAAITHDSVNKGQRTVGYRFAHAGLQGGGSRQFPDSDAPPPGSAEIPTVVVLVDPLDARRSRLVLRSEA